ncbi:hypothetical protein KW790_02720 [Candidatus Parcubacteria bacterium]|nr:hypothetical protein [Candidatus Parcubacteria bacterium]
MWKHWEGTTYKPSKFIRSVQIILLFLILIGLGLLASYKMWVPGLVDKILSHDKSYQDTLKFVKTHSAK